MQITGKYIKLLWECLKVFPFSRSIEKAQIYLKNHLRNELLFTLKSSPIDVLMAMLYVPNVLVLLYVS